MRRRGREPELPPAVLTITDPRTGAVTTTESLAPDPEPRPRRRPSRRVVVGVGAALVVAAAAVVVLVQRSGPDPYVSVDGQVLAQAVTDRPHRVWSVDLPEDASVVSGALDVVVTGQDDGGLVALGRDGERVWSYDEHGARFALPVGDGSVLLVVGRFGGVGAVATDDGRELWWRNDDQAVSYHGDALLLTDGDSTLTRVDAATGATGWTVDDARAAALTGTSAYVLVGEELRRLDAASGREQWAVPVELSGPQVAATDALVTVVSRRGITAYDADDGAELWVQQPPGGRGSSLNAGVYSRDEVFLTQGAVGRGEVVVRGRGEEVGSFSVGDGEFGFGTAVERGDERWFVSTGQRGSLYDERVRPVATYDGQVTPVDQGVYVTSDDGLSYWAYGDDEPTWRLDLPSDANRYSVVSDGQVVVADGRTLTAYR